MARSSIGFLAGFFALIFSAAVFAEEYELRFTAVSSFQSDRVLASTRLRFEPEVEIESMRLANPDGEAEPFYFVPFETGERQGRIFWMWDHMPHFHEMPYVLRVSGGAWSGEPFGDEEIGEKVRERKMLLSNPAFEEVEDGGPVGWSLTGTAELSQEESHWGENSVRIVGAVDDSGSARSDFFPIRPGIPHRLSFNLKITERREADPSQRHLALQSISARLEFFDEDRNRTSFTFPHYRTAGRDEEEYLGKWVEFSGTSNPSDENAVYGRLTIQLVSFEGVVFVDNAGVEESPRGQPVRVDMGELRRVR